MVTMTWVSGSRKMAGDVLRRIAAIHSSPGCSLFSHSTGAEPVGGRWREMTISDFGARSAATLSTS